MANVSMKHVGKIYRGGVEAVKDLNIEIKDGEFLCLLGPSGCGKSTTMRMIAGLEEITSGEMSIGGKRVNELSPRDRDVAMSFENYALYPNMDIYDNIAFPLQIRNMEKGLVHEKVMEVATLLGIQDMLTENVKGLPGGVQQRIGVARALVRNPKVLILDEPISHLEEELKAKMREELKRLQRKLGVTTLYVTHDQIEAMVMADRIAVMNFGVLQQVDTPENIFHHPANTFVGGFIGEPPMNFITCTFDQNPLALRFDDVTVPFNHATAHKLAGLGKKELILGIRDSHILVSTTQKEACVKGSVFFIEPRNEEMLLTVALGKQHLLVTIDTDSSIRIGDTLWVTFDYGKCSYFDVETKNNLL